MQSRRFYCPLVPYRLQCKPWLLFLLLSYLNLIRHFLSIILYLILGAIGLPIFSYGQGGFDKLIGPTGGFLLLFPIVAYLISTFKSKDKSIKDILIAILFSIVVLYPLATLWLSFSLLLDYKQALYIMLPFVPLDILKIVFAYWIYRRLPEDLI